ncbi:MAG: class I SAM-dependent methyltransferase [Alphaproteobacteria bacterium]
MRWRERSRRLLLGGAALLGIAKTAYVIPSLAAAAVDRAAAGPYADIESLFDANRPRFADWLVRIEGLAADLSLIGDDPAPAPRWTQDWFPRLDAAMAYAAVRTMRPRRIVEIGSGHSTRFLARAVADGGLETALTAIDPAPRAALAGVPGVEHRAATVQAAGLAPFAALEPGDILFIDSSHVLMPGSDVDMLLNRVLPVLPPGVAVHVHDIFLPDDYPADWHWRGYNEQLAVALLLQGGWQVEFAAHYAATRMAHALAQGVLAALPLAEGAYETSLWMVRH